MNKFYASVAAVFLASQLSTPLRAEPDQHGPPMDHQKKEEKRAEHQQKMLENMTKKLSLTDAQQKSIKTLLDQQGEKMEKIAKESMQQRKAVHDATDADIVKLLKDDQKKQYEQWKSERKEKFKERREEHEHDQP